MSSLTPTTTLTEEDEEEDTELRDLVLKALDAQGFLGQFKAQLRAQVYTTLEDANDPKKSVNPALQSYLRTSDGRLVVHLIREFLAFFNLNFTLSVFDPEALGCSSKVGESRQIPLRDRDQLVEGLGLTEVAHAKNPLLAEILRLSKVSMLKSETPTPTERSEDELSAPSSLDSAGALLQKSGNFGEGTLSNTSTPFQSLNASANKPTWDANLNNKREKEATPSASKSSPPSAAVKPFPKEAADSSRLVVTTSKPSPLGTLPPLNLGTSGTVKSAEKKTLAPLKKIPSLGEKSSPEKAKFGSELKKGDKVEVKIPSGDSLTKENKISSNFASFNPKESTADENNVHDDNEIEEDIEEFLNSSGGANSTTEDFTKDETISEVASLKADYAEKL